MTDPLRAQLSAQLAASRVSLPGTNNVRDLAGYPAAEGFAIGPRRLLRGEVLAEPGGREFQGVWEEAHQQAYASLELRTIIDLRAEREALRTPSAWSLATGAAVVKLPIEEGGEGTDTDYIRRLMSGDLDRFGEDQMTQFYCDTLDRRAATFAAAAAILAQPGNLPTLVHCSAGKDRTGLLIALVLDLLGTPRDVVVEDYALTGVFRPDRIETYAPMLIKAGVDPEAARALFESPAASMRGALEYLDSRYDGAASYLVGVGGLAPDDVAGLRRSLLVNESDEDRSARQ